mmetsp:Transcript_3568/g.9988  ORF Transcript_3568/g.9988 Transcript_3568/m.9988 type:complete len:409 (+) Transcript_3568:72-1298(+)
MSLLRLVIGVPAFGGVAAISSCRGFGRRLEQRLFSLSLPARPVHPEAMHPGLRQESGVIYRDFSNAVRSWKGGAILRQAGMRSRFAAEAERWVQQAFSEPSPPPVPSATNESANGTALVAPTTSCVAQLYSYLMTRIDARPDSFLSLPEDALSPRGDTLGEVAGPVLLSGGDRNAAMLDQVVANHARFARAHGYAHWWHKGSLVAARGWQPYWHKVEQLRLATRRFRNASAFVWVDDDIVLTNLRDGDRFAQALRRSPASLLVTRDPSSKHAEVNTGIIILRNTKRGRAVLEALWSRADQWRADGTSLSTDGQASCLHEQQALEEMLQSGEWASEIGVLEQRAPGAWNLNTFLRWSHYDAEREADRRYEEDSRAGAWAHGDFAGHCSGLSQLRRAMCMGALLGNVVVA